MAKVLQVLQLVTAAQAAVLPATAAVLQQVLEHLGKATTAVQTQLLLNHLVEVALEELAETVEITLHAQALAVSVCTMTHLDLQHRQVNMYLLTTTTQAVVAVELEQAQQQAQLEDMAVAELVQDQTKPL